MAMFSSVLLLILGLYDAVSCEGNDQGEAMENLLNKRCAQDIATILEDVKMLLADSPHGDIATILKDVRSQHRDIATILEDVRSQHRDVATILEDVKLLLAGSLHFLAQDCHDVREKTGVPAVSGLAAVYLYSPLSGLFQQVPTSVYCDQETAGGGWFLLMRRSDDSENFPDRSYDEYTRGFGNVTGSSFWLGLESMYRLTSVPGKEVAMLRVELEDWEGERRYAQYSYFRVSSGTDGYRMFVDGFSGDVGDSLTYHSGQRFSTKDKDQDANSQNCAEIRNGAWWYKICSYSCLTGEYIHGAHTDKYRQGVLWHHWRGSYYSYKIAEMKIRFPSKQNP